MANVLEDLSNGIANSVLAVTGIQIPIFNSGGRQIGYVDSAQDLANGTIQLFQGETNPGADGWFLNDFWGNKVAAAQYLVGRGYQPSWLAASDATAIKAQQSAGDPTLTQNWDFTVPPLDFGPFTFNATPGATAATGTAASPVNMTPYLIAGVGVLGLALLIGSGSTGGRRR